MSTPSTVSVGGNASGGFARPDASVSSSLGMSEEDDATYSPLPELRKRAARERRWLGETLIVLQERTHGKKKQLDMDSAALFVEESLANEEVREMSVCVCHA